jgi:hypothetical protein
LLNGNGLFTWASKESLFGRDLLQTAELGVFEALVGGDAWQAPAFDHLFTPEHRNLLTVALRLLSDILGEPLADRLGGLSQLLFDRAAPMVPDRRVPPESRDEEASPTLAQEENQDPH